MRRKFSNTGISLISLIITIIVIIILSAIVIFSGMDTPEKAQLSKVISDIDNVQTAVDQAYYGLYTEKAVAGEVWTQGQFYEAVATGEKNRDNLTGTGLIEIGENSLVDINLPKYEGRKWYIAVSDVSDTIKTGSAVLSPGFESQGKTYATLLDIQTGGSDGSGANGGSQGGIQDENALVNKVEIGDYIEYVADSENSYISQSDSWYGNEFKPENVTWRVWDKSADGTVRIIPSKPVNVIRFKNCGIIESLDIIENVCNLYSNDDYGINTDDIQSLKLEDLEKVSNIASLKLNYSDYGKIKTYTSGTFYVEDDGITINRAGRVASVTNPITIKNTWFYVSNISWDEFLNTEYEIDNYGTLIGDNLSILPNLSVYLYNDFVGYNLLCPDANGIYQAYCGRNVASRTGGGTNAGVRPLVSLSSSKLKVSGGDGTEASPWTLEKNKK